MKRCTIPPAGWWCSRTPGHTGPCAARSTLRVFDDPSNPHYGKVRRCWKMLAGLFPDLAKLDDDYFAEWGEMWDINLIEALQSLDERAALRNIIWRAIEAGSNDPG